MDRTALFEALRRERAFNVHSHHRPDGFHAALTLQSLLENSYVGWCTPSVPDGTHREEVDAWLRAVRARGYFVWLQRALRELYGLDEPLSFDSWSAYDAAVRSAHADPDWHLRAMRDLCGYETVLLDAFWNPGDDNGHPELFRPAYRVNSFFVAYDPRATDHNGHNALHLSGAQARDLEDLLLLLDGELARRHAEGAPVIKCALAYDRSLRFARPDWTRARRAMQPDPAPEDICAFQDALFHHICEKSAELRMPLQIHTGLGLMRDSRAMALRDAIAAHPETTFLLMHGSYPWTADVAGLTHCYPNVWADLCWLPLISTAAAGRALAELMDVCNADRMVWGCDTWTCEESYGAKLAMAQVLSDVLAVRVDAGLMSEGDALPFARMLLRENARRLLQPDA